MNFFRAIGYALMSTLNFEIFLKFPHFLRSYVLSRSANREVTRIFKFW